MIRYVAFPVWLLLLTWYFQVSSRQYHVSMLHLLLSSIPLLGMMESKQFCGFFLRLLASTWHLWSSYRIKPWKAGKLPSVSSLLEISTHLLNLSAFIYFPESSGSCWLLIAPSFSVVICRGGWSVRSSQFHTGDVISPLEIAFWTDSATSRAEMYVSDVYISKCLLAVLKIQIIGDSLDTLCGPGL